MPDPGPSADDRSERRNRRRAPWIAAGVIALLATLAGGWAIFVHETRPDAPGAFYEPPSSLPDGPPGTIIRSEVIDDFRAGATAYRVLYKSSIRVSALSDGQRDSRIGLSQPSPGCRTPWPKTESICRQ